MKVYKNWIKSDEKLAEAVYGTLYGLYLPEDEVLGVENLFAPGSAYEKVENEVYRLRQQLEDYMLVEQLVTQLYCIQKEMCLRMYAYGVKFGKGS